jgi:hypothetical protein
LGKHVVVKASPDDAITLSTTPKHRRLSSSFITFKEDCGILRYFCVDPMECNQLLRLSFYLFFAAFVVVVLIKHHKNYNSRVQMVVSDEELKSF